MDAEWISCRYFEFWDVPRALVLTYRGRTLLLDSPFEEEEDEYSSDFHVYELAPTPPEIIDSLSWQELRGRAVRHRADVPVASIQFDPVRQRQSGRFYARLRFLGTMPP